jgi:hypothetical protein
MDTPKPEMDLLRRVAVLDELAHARNELEASKRDLAAARARHDKAEQAYNDVVLRAKTLGIRV